MAKIHVDPLLQGNLVMHEHDVSDLSATGTPSASTYLRGDGSWATPAGSGAVLTDQTVGQTIGTTGARLTKLWATDIEVTNPITGSVTGSAATLTTTRTIWGQNFNGSANVTGALTGVTGITTSGGYTQSGTTANTFTGTTEFSNGTYSAIFTGGKVGIGTTVPSTKLTVAGTTLIQSGPLQLFNSGSTSFISDTVYPSLYYSQSGGTYPFNDNGHLVIQPRTTTGAAKDIVFATGSNVPLTRMVIASSGNVGIGTTSPQVRLDVSNGVADSTITSTVLRLRTAVDPAVAEPRSVDFNLRRWTTAGGTLANTALDIKLAAAGSGTGATNTDVMTLQSNGNVGIGTTAPIANLDVTGDRNQSGQFYVHSSVPQSDGTLLLGSTIGIGANIYAHTKPDGTVSAAASAPGLRFSSSGLDIVTSDETTGTRVWDQRMRIDIAGNVGIGTTGPLSYKLDISGTAPSLRLNDTGNGNDTSVLFGASYQAVTGAIDFHNAIAAGRYMAFRLSPTGTNNAATEYMRITDAGNVGIGTTAPAGKLDIQQTSTTAAIPTLILDQSDLSEEFIQFESTVGAGNPIDTAALGAYYCMARVSVNGTFKFLALYS